MHDDGVVGEDSPDVVVAAAPDLPESDPDPSTDGRDPEPDSCADASAMRRIAPIGARCMTDGPDVTSGELVVPLVLESVNGVAPDSAADPPDEAMMRKQRGNELNNNVLAQPLAIRLITCVWAGIPFKGPSMITWGRPLTIYRSMAVAPRPRADSN